VSCAAIVAIAAIPAGCANSSASEASARQGGSASAQSAPPSSGSTGGSGAISPSTGTAKPVSRELALQTFDEVWLRVNDTAFELDASGVDWNSARDEYRPRAETSTTQHELRQVLMEMLGRLGRSHFVVIPGEIADRTPPERSTKAASEDAASSGDAAHRRKGRGATSGATADEDDDSIETDASPIDDATFGLSLRIVDDRATIVEVAPASAAESAGVRPGWSIVTMDGVDPLAPLQSIAEIEGPMIRLATAEYARSLDTGDVRTHRFVMLDDDGRERAVTLRRQPSTTRMVKTGSLPPLPLVVESRWVDAATLARGGAEQLRIGVLRFSTWLPDAAPAIDRAIDDLRASDGLIIDLRGNPGGFGGMVMGVGGHFVRSPTSIGTMNTRDSTMEFRLNPRRTNREGRIVEPISAPLAILVDPLSASTSEIFAGGLQDIGRARIFGERSAGAALPSQMYRLPNGDVLLHAFADFRVPSGRSLEGAGVEPDEPRVLTREDLIEQGDPVLIDAVRWIRSATTPVP